jgi:hypothetical protein
LAVRSSQRSGATPLNTTATVETFERGVWMTIEDFEQLLTEKDVIKKFKLKKTSLQQARFHKRWPLRYLKIGRLVRYRASDIRAFLEAATRSGLEPDAPAPRKRSPLDPEFVRVAQTKLPRTRKKPKAKRGPRLLPVGRWVEFISTDGPKREFLFIHVFLAARIFLDGVIEGQNDDGA